MLVVVFGDGRGRRFDGPNRGEVDATNKIGIKQTAIDSHHSNKLSI